MGVVGVFFGRRGDGGFNGRCLGASIGAGGFTLVCISGCRGVIGFNVATSVRPVREKVRPARSVADASAKKFALRTKNGPQSAVYGVLGELFRENTAGWAVPGELFRGTAAGRTVLGEFWGYRTFRVAGVSPRCCGRGWRGGVRSSKLRRPSRG